MKKKIDFSLWQIVIGGLIFVLGLVLHSYEKISFGCYILAYVIVATEVYLSFFKHLSWKHLFDEKFLMIVATVGAFVIGEYPEAVAVMLFYQIGEYIGDRAVDRSKEKIVELMDLRADYANLLTDSQLKKVDPLDVKVGDIIVVKPGEKVPLDGVVIDGNGYVDRVMLTGESVPVAVEKNDEILSGSIVLNSVLTIKVLKESQESTVAKLLDLIQNAAAKKTHTETFITKFAKVYTPVVVIFAILICIVPVLFLHGEFYDWFYRSLVFLVVSCPCALVVSVPLGFFCGIGSASHRGILLKGSESLERLIDVDTFVFDKTGTLTKGTFEVIKVVAVNEFTKHKVLKYAAHAEFYSTHPIAVSIRKAYGKSLKREDITNLEEFAGNGVSITYQGQGVLVGNERLMEQHDIVYDRPNEVGTIVYLAVDGNYKGYLVISDQLKSDAQKTISSLKKIGISNIYLLSGDREEVVSKVSSELGIQHYFASLLPQDKVKKVEELINRRDEKHLVAFVGDGINDAPVLMLSDLGISMGGIGSDAAIEASDMVIMNDQPSKILEAITIAKRTRKIVWQNIILAIGVKMLVLILGALGITGIWLAVFADVGVTVLAVINALRIWYYKK